MIKNGRASSAKAMLTLALLLSGLFIHSTALAIEAAQAQELELEIHLVGENDSLDKIVNTISIPDFNFIAPQAQGNAVSNAVNNESSSNLSGQEKSALAKSQAYGLIKENKKEKVKKEKVKKDKNENSNNNNNNNNNGNGNNN